MKTLFPKKLLQLLSLLLLGSALAVQAFAQDCSITVDTGDILEFSVDTIEVPENCSDYTVTLTHSGELPKTAMGHNWVLTEAEDVAAVAQDGIEAGLDNNYVKPDDERVIAFTEIIGGGEQTSVTFPVDEFETGTNYTFFCSFPGHSAVMQGTLTLGS